MIAEAEIDLQEIPGTPRRVVFVTSSRATARIEHRQLVVDGPDGATSLPLRLIERLVLLGDVGLSAALRTRAMRDGPEIVFLSRSGELLGNLGNSRDRPPAVMRQYQLLGNEAAALAVARQVVVGKLANQGRLLSRYRRVPPMRPCERPPGSVPRPGRPQAPPPSRCCSDRRAPRPAPTSSASATFFLRVCPSRAVPAGTPTIQSMPA